MSTTICKAFTKKGQACTHKVSTLTFFGVDIPGYCDIHVKSIHVKSLSEYKEAKEKYAREEETLLRDAFRVYKQELDEINRRNEETIRQLLEL